MSSNPPAEPRRAILRSPRGWSLRTRLLVTLIALLAVVCAAIGLATEFALQRFLMNQLDEQVVEAGNRSAVIFEFGPPPPPGMGRPDRRPPGLMLGPPPGPPPGLPAPAAGPGPEFLNAPGQAVGTVGAVVAGGRPLTAGVITADGARAQISSAAAHRPGAVRNDG